MNENIEEIKKELQFMYAKYEELCVAFKKLARNNEENPYHEVHDMSHMIFSDSNSENKGDNK